jgi:FMN phosphatase YigB (HAD superfamily)
MILLFDAANTIIYKPLLFKMFAKVLCEHGIQFDIQEIERNHKLISECIQFPDRTNRDFYNFFNKEVLYSIGLIADMKLLNDLFDSCSYLPWEKFDDTKYISELSIEKAVISNFRGELHGILNQLFPDEFTEICISEDMNLRKPDPEFFTKLVDKLSIDPKEIILIGDSIKLDIEPGLLAGIDSWLIDRNNYYPYYSKRIRSLYEMKTLVKP